MTTPDIYKQLATHLDGLPAGYPPTEDGVELRILKRLFTTDEAELAVQMSMIPETADQVAKRLDRSAQEVADQLYDMSKKGLLFRFVKGEQHHYMAAQFVIGIWEYHLNDLDTELIRDVNAYIPYLMKKSWMEVPTKQLRVIPISQSLSADMQVMPYEAAEDIVRKQSKIVVSPCICRKEHEMAGKGCGKASEACISFGAGAHYYEENGLGREVTAEEAIEILALGKEHGLVLQPGNAQRPFNICMCCGCCCQVLKNLKTVDQPAKVVSSNYFAVVDTDNCTACESCVDQCQMDAIEVNDVAEISLDRCIGCGLCVAVCEFDALQMKAKDPDEQQVPPPTITHTYMNIAKERGLI